jgi:hypothetical protein
MTFRRRIFAAAIAATGTLCALGAPPLAAQSPAPSAGPLALLVPASARAASLGNAWVAGRDEYVIFSNPALVSPTPGFGFSFGSFSHGDGRSLSTAAAVAVGTVNLGWGVHVIDFSTPRANTTYPFAPAAISRRGDADITSMVAVAAANMVYKGFRIGLSAKYAQDIAAREASTSSLLVVPTRGWATLADVGVSHPLWTGIAGLSVQNIAAPYKMGTGRYPVPSQIALGWTKNQVVGPFDVGYATQVTARREGWISPAAGIDIGWGWIEGYSLNGRVGARRTETDDERPVTVGATGNADRLNLEWGMGFYTENHMVHRLTVRWR